MTRIAITFAGFLLAGQTALAAEQPPQINLEPTCTVAAAGVSGRSRDACMNDEKAAHKTLNDKWKSFTVTQQRRCTDLVHMGGPPSYVELLTCLEMAEQARQIPDRDLLNGKSPKLTE
jgi:hypothetical protein